ncbi:hypothetical protein C0995_006546 [Termitomyces sp. Mi166|nr:hypothetical protein C0995_006546 [Termitomyces sp. Mi166\
MPSITIDNDITFYYTDSGTPSESTYAAIFFIHGHTFHSGIFQRLAKFAGSRQLRVIALNRRGYPGTTPYTNGEQQVLRKGSFEERKEFLYEQGKLIALVVDGLIQQLSLPQQVTVAAWSLGTALLLSMYCSINRLTNDVQQRLKRSVKAFVFLDTTTYPLGIPTPPGGYIPLFDSSLSPEQKAVAFSKWISSYYQHGDLSSRDISELRLSLCGYDLLRQPTTQTMTPAELGSSASFTANTKYDTLLIVPDFFPVLKTQTDALLFDSQVREAWGKPNFWCLYGEASVWTCIYGSWYLERGWNPISFKSLRGANHFVSPNKERYHPLI